LAYATHCPFFSFFFLKAAEKRVTFPPLSLQVQGFDNDQFPFPPCQIKGPVFPSPLPSWKTKVGRTEGYTPLSFQWRRITPFSPSAADKKIAALSLASLFSSVRRL